MKRLVVAFMAFNILDLLLTLVILELGGDEKNPIMRLAFEQPLPVAISLKIGLGAGAAVLLVWMAKRGHTWPLRAVTYAMIGICIVNASGLLIAGV